MELPGITPRDLQSVRDPCHRYTGAEIGALWSPIKGPVLPAIHRYATLLRLATGAGTGSFYLYFAPSPLRPKLHLLRAKSLLTFFLPIFKRLSH